MSFALFVAGCVLAALEAVSPKALGDINLGWLAVSAVALGLAL